VTSAEKKGWSGGEMWRGIEEKEWRRKSLERGDWGGAHEEEEEKGV